MLRGYLDELADRAGFEPRDFNVLEGTFWKNHISWQLACMFGVL
jgi:hypothetical protein